MNIVLVDLNDGTVITEAMLKQEWKTGRENDLENTPRCFEAYLLEVILATINGRNDLDIIGVTPRETMEYIEAIREKIRNGNGGKSA